jgi:predicted nucleic-acid-binding protein
MLVISIITEHSISVLLKENNNNNRNYIMKHQGTFSDALKLQNKTKNGDSKKKTHIKETVKETKEETQK